MKGSTKRENIARLPQDVVLWAGQMKVTEGTSFVKNTDYYRGGMNSNWQTSWKYLGSTFEDNN